MHALTLAARAAALASATALAVSTVHFGHGGTYRGPGDTVPPGGGGSGGGVPTTPGPTGPGTPTPGSPSTPFGGNPGTPGGPAGTPGTAPISGGGDFGPDLTSWTFWWEFNKDRYLHLKDAIHRGTVSGGASSWWLGDGERGQGEAAYKPSEATIRTRIVPALLATLESNDQPDIVTGCLIALARIGDERSESGVSAFQEVIASYLSDASLEVRETAAVSLGVLANEAAVPMLEELMNDSPSGRKLAGRTEVNYRVRAFAAYGLGLVAKKTAREPVRERIAESLMGVLSSKRSRDHDLNVAALIAFGLSGLDTVNPPEGIADEDIRPWTSLTAQVDAVLALLRDKDRHHLLRAHAPTALARLLERMPEEAHGYETIVADVVEALCEPLAPRSKEKDVVVQSCTLALGQIIDNDGDLHDREARADLVRMAADGDQQTRRFALIGLAQAAGRMGDGPEPGVGIQEVSKVLSKTLARGKSELVPWAGLAVGIANHELLAAGNTTMPTGLLVALREELAQHKSPFPALALGAALAGDKEALPAIREGFDRSQDDVEKGYAAVAMGLLNDTYSIEHIEKALESAKYRPELLKQSAIALGLMGNKQVGKKLVDLLKESHTLTSQASVATALGFIGDRDSVEPLIDLLEEGDQDLARAFAAVSLGLVADKETQPWNAPIAWGINYRASTPTLNSLDGTGILNIL